MPRFRVQIAQIIIFVGDYSQEEIERGEKRERGRRSRERKRESEFKVSSIEFVSVEFSCFLLNSVN